MEHYFATIFEDVRHKRSLILLLSLVKPDILEQSKLTDQEIAIIKKICSRKITSTTQSQRDYRFGYVKKNNFLIDK